MFEYRFIRFQYHHERHIFEPIVFNANLPYNMIHETLTSGTSTQTENAHKNYHVQRTRYGICDILIPIEPIGTLLLREVLNPFYLFQVTKYKFIYLIDILIQLVVLGSILLLCFLPSCTLYHIPRNCIVGYNI